MSLDGWSLEVVRGKSVGRLFPLSGSTQTLGNALDGLPGVDLSAEEGDGPRRMAGRQASIESSAAGLSIRDLDSPGGTFVNRKRILPGQAASLAEGDVLQVGGIQLKVVGRSPSPSHSPTTATAGWSLPIPGGNPCRSWDEILTASAQRWSSLRDEVTSGRIDAFVRSIGRPDLAPPAGGTADDRLDGWLGLIPATKGKSPALEVHPAKLVVKVAGGATTRRSLNVTNVGYRLLKVDVRVIEGDDWLKLVGDAAKGTLSIVESATISVEVSPSENLNKFPSGKLVFESNGGRVEVVVAVEASKTDDAPPVAPARPIQADRLAGVSMRSRLIGFSLGAVALRGVVGLAARFIDGGAWIAASTESPALFGPVALGVAIGAAAGLVPALRRGEDLESRAAYPVALGLSGGFAAVLVVATARAIEPLLGGFGANFFGQGLIWAALGAATARGSAFVSPPNPKEVKT